MIGERLTELRIKHNMTQEEFAERLDVSRQAVSKWELDKTLPDVNKLLKISELYQVDVDYLLKGAIEEPASDESDEEHVAASMYDEDNEERVDASLYAESDEERVDASLYAESDEEHTDASLYADSDEEHTDASLYAENDEEHISVSSNAESNEEDETAKANDVNEEIAHTKKRMEQNPDIEGKRMRVRLCISLALVSMLLLGALVLLAGCLMCQVWDKSDSEKSLVKVEKVLAQYSLAEVSNYAEDGAFVTKTVLLDTNGVRSGDYVYCYTNTTDKKIYVNYSVSTIIIILSVSLILLCIWTLLAREVRRK